MFVALKPVTIGGRRFIAGEPVPTELVDAKRAKKLRDYRIIADAPEIQPEMALEAADDEDRANTNPQGVEAILEANTAKNDAVTADTAAVTEEQPEKAAEKPAASTGKKTAKKG